MTKVIGSGCSVCGHYMTHAPDCTKINPNATNRPLDTSKLGRIAIDHNPNEARAKMVREALERVARHVCWNSEMSNHMLALAVSCDDDSLAALGRMLR